MNAFSGRIAMITSLVVTGILSVGSIMAALSQPPAAPVSTEREPTLQPSAEAPLPLFPGRD